jgi:UDP-N-acetylglucosamine acyltransferase
MEARVHPSSIVESGARLGRNVVVGPFCVVGAQTELGEGVELVSHAIVAGATRVGPGTRIFSFACVGSSAQDMKAVGESGSLSIGADCIIREGVTVNVGTPGGGSETRVGNRCALLAYSHVAHDCRLGDSVVLSNNVLLGGHVEIGDHVMIGGASAVHQHARIGAHAFVAAMSGVEGDVAPYMLAAGNRAHLFGLNLVGLQRRGFLPERISRIKAAYRLLFGRRETGAAGSLAERIETLADLHEGDADIGALVDFLRQTSNRPLCAPRAGSTR